MLIHKINTEKANVKYDRFREIISDPHNILIERVPNAGYVANNCVILHNGNIVSLDSYYGRFSDILILNRGVHEPLEEYCFQQVLKIMPAAPTMLELGAYWAHYSMWLMRVRREAKCFILEPDDHHMDVGKLNILMNNYRATHISGLIGKNHLNVDKIMSDNNIDYIDILHSDIQGYEIDMLEEAKIAFENSKIGYAFISTHSQELHDDVLSIITNHNYNIIVSSDFLTHTTSYDGFVLASSNKVPKIFRQGWTPIGRVDIVNSTPLMIQEYIAHTIKYNQEN